MAVSQARSYHLYQASMLALVQRVREIDVGTFETATREVLSRELHPRTTTLLAQADQLVGDVLDACQPTDLEAARCSQTRSDIEVSPPPDDFEIAIDAAIVQGTPRSSRVADIAFMAQVELRQRALRLASIAPDPTSLLLAECDSALRRVTKALCALDRAIARAGGTPAYLDYLSELELSLRVRQCYAVFRARVLAGREQLDTLEDVEARLRRTGNEIAIIVGHPIYSGLRLNDRIQLRNLQQRIVTWIKSPARELVGGLRIWKDVSAFVAMLRHVDRRQELFEHDSRVVYAALESLTQAGEVSERSLLELRALEGRDDEVDALLSAGLRDGEQWAALLTRLASEVGNRRPSSRP
jgi:hypothetical protein